MMVKDHVRIGMVGEVGDDIVPRHGNRAVLHVLGVGENDFLHHAGFPQQGCADNAVEVATRNEAMFL